MGLTSLGKRGGELTKKVTKTNTGERGCSQRVISLTQNCSVHIFSATHFLLLCTSEGSDDTTECNNKNLQNFNKIVC